MVEVCDGGTSSGVGNDDRQHPSSLLLLPPSPPPPPPLLRQIHLDWSDQQRRILTDNGNAELWYCSERGYPFTSDELPHYYLQKQQENKGELGATTTATTTNTRHVFQLWKWQQQEQQQQEFIKPGSDIHAIQMNSIVGIWERTLFYGGGFEYTTNHNEYTYNVQTSTLFIDLRIPKTRDEILLTPTENGLQPIQSLNDMNMEQLRYYARQHIFAGYTKVRRMKSNVDADTSRNSPRSSADRITFPYCATRYHCMDWNYVGIPRSRPNKWYIELPLNHHTDRGTNNNNNNNNNRNDDDDIVEALSSYSNVSQWKEWAYATNQYQQQYYCEHWRRYNDNNNNHQLTQSDHRNIFLILRTCDDPDGIIIIWNDHIMYCIDRVPIESLPTTQSTLSSLVAVVDDLLLQKNDIEKARKYLSMQGGHGQWKPVSTNGIDPDPDHDNNSNTDTNNNCRRRNGGGWILDHCIEFWKQGQKFFGWNDEITLNGTTVAECQLRWKHNSISPKTTNETLWYIFDTNLDSIDAIRVLLLDGPNGLYSHETHPQHQAQRFPKL
jgi:hypothetical protein